MTTFQYIANGLFDSMMILISFFIASYIFGTIKKAYLNYPYEKWGLKGFYEEEYD